MSDTLKSAIARAGGPTKVSRLLGVRREAIYDFINRGYLPAEHCPKIELATRGKVLCEDLNSRVDWHVVREMPYREATAAQTV